MFSDLLVLFITALEQQYDNKFKTSECPAHFDHIDEISLYNVGFNIVGTDSKLGTKCRSQ